VTTRAVATKGDFVGIFLMAYLTPGRLSTADDVIRHVKHAYRIFVGDHFGISTGMPVSPSRLPTRRIVNK
jgi:microsomal dipeptidase-like Zn-dependent dipeptidase